MIRLLSLCLFTMFAACDGDKGETLPDGEVTDTGECEPNQAPKANITSHSDGDEVPVGEVETFEGVVSDADHDNSELLVMWTVDGEVACAATAPDPDGTTSCDIVLDEDDLVVRLIVVDPEDASDSDTVVLDVTNSEASEAPDVTIVLPDDGASYTPGDEIPFEGLVSDDEDAASDLEVWWTSDLDGTLPIDATPDADGNVTGTGTLSPGTHTLTLWARDSDGNIGSDTVVITVGNPTSPPTCTITDPTSGSSYAEGETVEFAGLVSDAETPTEELGIVWASDQDGSLDTGSASSDGTVGFSTADLSSGTHVVILAVTDGEGATCTDYVAITVVGDNHPPSQPVVEITPDPADTTDDLVVTFIEESVDPDGDEVTYTYSWYVDGEYWGDTTEPVLPADATTKGETWTVVVTPSDGETEGDPGDDEITIGNAPPSIESVEIIPDPAYTDDTLTCTYDGYYDPDGDPDLSTFSWTVNGTYAGAGDTLTGGFVSGDTVVCTVTPYDGEDTGTPVSDSIVISNTPPVLEDVTLTPDPAYEGDTLTCTPGVTTDADGTTSFTYAYAWVVNGVEIAPTGSTLSSDWFQRDDEVYCVVTPSDGIDWGEPVPSNTVTIGNTAPSATVSLSPTTVYTDDVLTASVSTSDVDGDSITLTYYWYVNGVLIGASGSTLDGSIWFDKGDEVTVVVVPDDGTDEGPPATTVTIVVLNSPPTAPDVQISPPDPTTEEDLVCVIETPSTDADGDTITYTFDWLVDGTAYTAATSTSYIGDTVPSADTTEGETWTCIVTPNDGEEDGPSDSDTVTIGDDCVALGGNGTDGDLTATGTTTLDLGAVAVIGDNPVDSTVLQVADSTGFIAGDEVLVITMSEPGDTCDGTGAGNWERHFISSISSGSLHLRGGLAHSFDTSGGAVHQVVRIPHFADIDLSGTLTAPAWNGETGGVLMFRAQSLHLRPDAEIDMIGRGYQGGESGSSEAGGPLGRVAVAGGSGGAGGTDCDGCTGGAGTDGVDGGGGGGSGGGNTARASGGTCGGGGGAGVGTSTGAGGDGPGAGGDGGSGGSGLSTAGGAGGGCAYTAQDVCTDDYGTRLFMGPGATAGASGGCADGGSGGLADGDSSCATEGSSGAAGGGIIVLLISELSTSDDIARIDAWGADGGNGGVGEDGAWAPADQPEGEAGAGGGSGGDGGSGGTIMIVVETFGDGTEYVNASSGGASGGMGGHGGDSTCGSSGSVSGGADGDDGTDGSGTCAGSGGSGEWGSDGDDGTIYVFGSSVDFTFPYVASPVEAMEFWGGVECFLEL